MDRRKLSLSLAKQERTCPPSGIRADPAHRLEVERHLAVCPYCTPEAGPDPWAALVDRFAEPSPARPQRRPSHIRPGDIHTVQETLGRWHGAFYYRPPVVLILGRNESRPDSFQVCQCYHDPVLAAPGDLLLPEGDAPFEGFFVECWNTYTLSRRDFGECMGRISPAALDAAAALAGDDRAYPDWALPPKPMTGPEDPRRYFRELEVETGQRVASTSAETWLTKRESHLLSGYAHPAALVADMRRANPGVRWRRLPATKDEVLALVEFPAEQLPLAAAGPEARLATATLMVFHSGAVERVVPLRTEIFMEEVQGKERLFSGRVYGLPRDLDRIRFTCYLLMENKEVIGARLPILEPETGSFSVRFPVPENGSGTLAVAISAERASH